MTALLVFQSLRCVFRVTCAGRLYWRQTAFCNGAGVLPHSEDKEFHTLLYGFVQIAIE